jgi:hypothetical protein
VGSEGGVTEVVFHREADVPEDGEVWLGNFPTAPYERIRILALGPQVAGETNDVELTLSLIEGQGTPGPLDRILISSRSSVTEVYEVPGRQLGASAKAQQGATSIDLWVWGYRCGHNGMVIDPEAAHPEAG